MILFTYTKLLISISVSVFIYYLDILTDIAVLSNYWRANETGFFGITCFAIFSSLLAQILYSPLLSIYRTQSAAISTPSCIFRLLLSTLYLTPIYLLYKFLHLQCCRLAKGTRDELQLAKISDGSGMNGFIENDINIDIEQQRQDPNMIDMSILDSGILTETRKKNLLISIFDDMIFVLGEYFLFKDSTRSNKKDTISLSGNDVLLFPDDTQEVYLLMISTAVSFICLCTASWSQISDLVKTSPQSELNWCIPFLFRIRAILESGVRVLRFMTVSVIFGAFYGVILIITELIWKYIILSCCDSKRNKRRKKRRQQKKNRRKQSGYSGRGRKRSSSGGNDDGNNNQYSQMGDGINDKYINKGCGSCGCCDCDMELHKNVFTWMLFSKEKFKKNPCLMRFTDIVVWTILLLGGTCLAIELGNVGKVHGVCNRFLFFQEDCLPLEIVIAITTLIVLLLIIYVSSPSIFNLVSSLDQDIFGGGGRKQKLLNGGGSNGIIINNDEYESEEDDESNITVIDISKPVQNPTLPKKPKRKYSNSSSKNLIMMSIDDEQDYDYQQSNQ